MIWSAAAALPLSDAAAAAAARRSYLTKAPPADDVEQWQKVEFLVQHGFSFASQHTPDGVVTYPKDARRNEEVRPEARAAAWPTSVATERFSSKRLSS
ncbi:MAG TPA: hypothetical protein VEK79_19610 [Thermoanaerobaculia bacterium]|nr:hypothetical protein [Thermoanaerobaculia bacterium]